MEELVNQQSVNPKLDKDLKTQKSYMNGSRSQGLIKFQRPGLKRLNVYLRLNLVWIPSFLS